MSARQALAVLSIAVFALVSRADGAAGPRLMGHWEGSIRQPAGPLRIVVDARRQADTLHAVFSLPAAAVFEWPLAIRVAPPRVSLALPNGVVFEGRLGGNVISGTVPSPNGGRRDAFTLKRRAATPPTYRQEDVTFRSGRFTMAGTLRVPLSKRRHPALCLLTGSGDVDREGESFYADYFARQGFATLVYDKRGTGRSEGDYRDESFDDFAGDALAAIDLLQRRSDIDPRRVGLYGRSHGGIVIPLAAAHSSNVAFIINVGGAGVSPHEQVTYQAETQMRRDGFSEADIAEAMEYLRLKWDVARSGGKGWEKLEAATQNARDKKWLPRVQPASKLDDILPSWRLQMGYDPMPALEGVKCPILALFGGEDTFTPVELTIANYRKAAETSGNRDLTTKVFPDADHSLLVWPKPGDPAHWPHLAEGYLDTMKVWIHRHAGH